MLQDDDPYVRKTAAMCVAKLHDINSELVEDQGFLDTLKVGVHLKSNPDSSSKTLFLFDILLQTLRIY